MVARKKLHDIRTTLTSNIKSFFQPDKVSERFIGQLRKSFNRSIFKEKKFASFYMPLFILRRIALSFIALFA